MLLSGNVELILKYYQELLNIIYRFVSVINMEGYKIININELYRLSINGKGENGNKNSVNFLLNYKL